jgi:hypothetical protein
MAQFQCGYDAFSNCRKPGDVYAFARELEKLHSDNRHVRDKIRQQFQPSSDFSAASQVLHDAKLLIHAGSGLRRLP